MLIWLATADIRNPELSWSWQRVGVLDYEPKSKQWLVQKSDGCNRVLDEQKNPVVNGGLQPTGHFTKLPSQYWIPRIQIRFIAEDPVIFAKRIATAFRAREDTEAGIRYNLYLDCMPTEGLVEMDQAALKRIKYLAKDSTPVLKTKPGLDIVAQQLEKEIIIDHWRSMNDLILRKFVADNPDEYSFIKPPKYPKKKWPWKGTVEIPRYDFVIKFDEFAFHTLFGKTEAIVANCTAQFECLEARSRLLLHMPVVKAVRLEEFEQTQAQTTQQSSTFLKEAWIENMRRHIRIALRDSGKGWFNIYETDYYVYTNSKLKRFLNMIKYCMQDALRYLVMDSIGGFVKMVEDACFTCIKLTNGYEWTNDLRTSSVLPKKNALFLVDLVIDKDGVHYSTLLGQFEKVLWGLFDKAIKSIQNISQVERFVVEGISWSDNPLLEAVGAHEPDVEKLRAKLRSCLQAANIPMIAYAEKYKEYIELSELDITHYIKVYETQNQGALEVKQEVERQLEEQQKIEDRMPCTIVIGPFLVNVEPLRARLMKKRNDMAKAMLDLLARQLRKEADKTCEIFQGIAARLFERPNTIEELTELREYIDNIPETMEEQQENIDKCLADYDLIDDFYYNISNDDFTAKWTTIGWPNKVRNIVAQVEMQLEEDEERFRKLQISDLATFADKLDSLTVMVSSMASFTDVSKAHEVANEVRRIHRQLLEAQNLAAVYNSRERLFEMPVTNFEKIGTLLKDFEPFRQLWIAVSDWLKTQDAVMTDPLNSVDASAVEKQVTECYKIMHKSMRTFAELAGVQEVASQIKMAVEEFKPFIPLVQALRNPGMRSRHWELMSETIGIQVVPKASLTFAKCLEMRLQDHIEDIAKIADAAGKEYAIEFSLNKMMSEWEPVNFEVVPYKNTVKSVISAAGNLKRNNPDMDEDVICLRAIRDVNLPKFLVDDLKLFNGIVSDLFPRIRADDIDYGDLMTSLKTAARKMGLKDAEGFMKKCIQLFETTVVRHGLMLVGPTGSGKTKCYEVLRDALTALRNQTSPDGSPFTTVHSYVLNPKSITMGQLYGEFDLLTHEWTDGILSVLIREGVVADDIDKRWYVFDGPVDAVWIENMNTVLDDNKKLCLSSGEIIKLTETMTMMFEVADLAVASPATVSRCGMVYLEPSILGLKPFVECWLAKLPPPVYPHREKLGRLFDFYLEDSISFIRDHTKELIPTTDGQLTFSFLKLFACFFQRFLPKEDIKKGVPRKKDKEKAKKEQNMKLPLRPMGADPNDSGVSEELISRVGDVIESWFFFSLVWSIGASCTNDGRKAFDAYLRQKMKDLKCFRPFPAEGLVYDYFLNEAGTLDLDAKDEEDDDGKPKKVHWENWMQNLKPYTITPTMKYSEILVPTMDNVRLIRLMEMLLLNKRPVICVGPTGTGKTVCIADKLTSGMPKEYIPEFMVFSAKTSANQTQDLIDGKLDKRRKGIFGPPAGKYIIFFIDDLNMPAPEVYGAQPPIELLRQWMDFNGWYDRKTIGAFRTIVDVNFLGALCPPGGGRNPITQRLMRHFNFLSFNELDESSLMTIFPTIVRSWLGQAAEDSPVHALLEYVDRLVKASVDVYTTVQSQLLPTPAKSHYTFNLRDLAHVFQGMLMMDISSLTGELTQILRLWYHESCRVYQDRLINDTDRNWFKDLIKKSMNDVFATPFETAVPSEPLLYGDFLTGAAVEMRKYIEMEDHAVVQRVIEENLEDYNQVSTTQMNLVLFMDAIIHICRIARIIRQPQSNALLLGLGGSGRQSAAKLAAHISEFDCFRIELTKTYSNNDWLEDLRKVMMAAGIENKETMFLFSDTQIKSESFLEDLNNILNAGDVPNIYGFEDLEGIYNAMKVVVAEQGLPATKTNLFSAYVKRVRSNLHTVITMSPLGEIFRARLRQFPALVSCCTIDWYSEWPDEALESVGMRALRDVTELNVPDEILTGIVKMCQEIHQSAVRNTARCLSELGRHNYVTPTSFLELLGAFTKMYSLKLNEIVTARDRTKIGLDKLLYTETFVAKLQEELEIMKPALEQAVEESKVTMEEIARDSAVAAETTAVVSKQEESASKKAEECTAIKDDAQRDLDEAMPALYASLEAVKSLNKNDITEVRAMMRPPEGVRLVMEAVCIMKDVKPKKVAGDKPGVKVDDYWEPGKALLQDPGKFLDSLLTYDRDNIPDSIIARIQPYIDSDAFTPAAIQKVSKACTSICLWVRAMHKYHNVAKSVAPKRAALQAAEIELKATEAILAEARERLKACQDRIASLQTKYDECIRKQKELEDKSALCEARLIRADKLIGGLASEKSRWIVSVDTLDELANNLVGNVLVSSGAVAYLGPFNGEYRAEMCADWIEKLKTLGVPHTTSPAPNLIDTFGDPVKIRNWHIFGLPKDGLSVENAVIVQFSRRWPLFVDPQGQANRWIKALEYDDGVEVLKFSDKEFLRTLENAIRFGKPCLFENIGEELDPVLDPIIMKQTFKQQGTLVIKLGDSIIPYHDDFRLYLTTKLPNPHYKPEITARLTIVNFTLSPSDHVYSPSGIYKQISPESDHAGYLAYIRTLPINDLPEVFGLHDNANITFAQNETFALLGDLLKLQPKTSSSAAGSLSREEIIEGVANDLVQKCPAPFNVQEVSKQYPVLYEQSMNTVLIQEVIRFNGLLDVMALTLKDLLKALKGLVVMSAPLEAMATSLFNNQVPALWANKAYPSLKPLASWMEDLQMRINFIQEWIDNGIPVVYWISGFFFPQAFLTGTLQNYARKMKEPVDTITFDFQVMKENVGEIQQVPEDGCYIRGLYLEGARWDPLEMLLAESRPKELYTVMSVIWLIPRQNRQRKESGIYECPVYKTITRSGTLSTTGMSTNFVFTVELPTTEEQKHWIKRGVALLCALNY
nr:unnamed protein product [Spirometra erinaceieuropaei]